jgi:hypothetical protein
MQFLKTRFNRQLNRNSIRHTWPTRLLLRRSMNQVLAVRVPAVIAHPPDVLPGLCSSVV